MKSCNLATISIIFERDITCKVTWQATGSKKSTLQKVVYWPLQYQNKGKVPVVLLRNSYQTCFAVRDSHLADLANHPTYGTAFL